VEGPDHPDIIVETASLASVTPPDPKYTVHPLLQVRLCLYYFRQLLSGNIPYYWCAYSQQQ
jgi:hypothetical protein